jgi:hypothetical protein
VVKKGIAIFGVIILIWLFFYPYVSVGILYHAPGEISFKKGEEIKLKQLIRFKNPENLIAYLILSGDEMGGLPPSIAKYRVLKTSDQILINRLLNSTFVYTNGDMATVSSSLVIYSENKLVFSSAIVLDSPSNGLQSNNTGWLESSDPKELVALCSKFKPYYMPILILN